MGGGVSKSKDSGKHAPAPTKQLFSEKQARMQIKKIDKLAPRKRLEDSTSLKLKLKDEEVTVPYAYVSQTGYYPNQLDKANQDCLNVIPDLGGLGDTKAFFGVYDGHGKVGDACSNFVRDELAPNLCSEPDFSSNKKMHHALKNAFIKTNEELHQMEKIGAFSDIMSGTTAITMLLDGDTMHIANCGDSRAIAILKDDQTNQLKASPLSIDQTPFRRDERERVSAAGARVLTMSQLEGVVDPENQDFGDEDDNDGDPPRLWTATGKYPGTAFTRSLGDRVAEEIGVYAEPEIYSRPLDEADQYILLASDGVFEFITSQGVVDIFSRFRNNLINACRAIVAEAYRQWLQYEIRTDDITCMIVDVRNVGRAQLSKEMYRSRLKSFSVEVLFEEIQIQSAANGGEDARRKSLSSALTDGTSFKLDRPVNGENNPFSGMELRPVRRKVANTVGVVRFDPAELEGYSLPTYEKTEDDKLGIRFAISNNYLFAHLSDDQLEKAIMAMEKLDVKKGDVVIKQFDKGDRFYVAARGKYGVEVAVPKTATNGDSQIVIDGQYEEPREVMEYNCEEGGVYPCFGELALMYNKPRAATITAKTDGTLWALERRAFHSVLMRDSAHKLVRTLRKVKTFSSLTYNEIARLAELLTEVEYKAGENVVRQGDPGDAFFVIKKGHVSVSINTKNEDGEDEVKEVMKLSEYDYFGERALLNSVPRAATVTATDDVTCLMIRKSLFDEVLGKLESLLQADGQSRETTAESYYKVTSLEQLRIFPGTIPFFSGSLYRCQVREAKNNKIFGTLRRILIPTDESEKAETKRLLLKELEMLERVASPQLLASFNNPSNPHVRYQLFKEEFVVDLHSVIQDRPFDPTSKMFKYAIKSIASALVRLQGQGVVSRGVTPEGVLIDLKGHVLLTDFRFAKQTNFSRTYTACGTPEYMAPEQIKGAGHGYPVDWWSLGVLMCEMTNGQTPFANLSETEMYGKISDPLFILEKISDMQDVFGRHGLHLFRQLLCYEPDSRLIFTDEDELETIPFFARLKLNGAPFKALAETSGRKLMQTDKSIEEKDE